MFKADEKRNIPKHLPTADFYETDNRFTLITIYNWDNYQNPDKEKPVQTQEE